MSLRKLMALMMLLCASFVTIPARSSAQVNTVNLSGSVLDPQNLAVKDAKLTPEDIDYVNAHGTSTPLGDTIETRALKRVFGDRAKEVPISSTKSMTGHLLGGAGGLEAGIIVLALRDQILPPTINQETPDPECDLDYIPNVARKAHVEYALSNSFGFGGTNAALIFKRWAGQ